jgi:hypothetical protein
MTNALTVRSATQRGPGEQGGIKNTTGSLPLGCEFFCPWTDRTADGCEGGCSQDA